MPDSNPPPRPGSPTALPSLDTLGLGRTAGQRGAEIMAGVRAETMPSPVTIALSRTSGRVAVRLMRAITRNRSQGVLNFLPIRTGGITELIKEAVQTMTEKLFLVDIAAGFSPRGIELAQAFPDADVLEIDLPDVIQEKRKRLEKARNVLIPANLEWRAADMGITPLAEVLQNRRAQAISAEGLTPYFPPDQIVRIIRQIHDNLIPGGVFACDMAWKEGIRQTQEVASFLSRQAGVFVGAMTDQQQVYSIFQQANYDQVRVYLPSEVAQKFRLPQPVSDLQFLVTARRKPEDGSAPKPGEEVKPS